MTTMNGVPVVIRPMAVETDGITFEFRDGTQWYISAQEFYELLMFVVELKSASEQRRREVLGD